MRIEISVAYEGDEYYEHEGYYDSIEEAIDALQRIKNRKAHFYPRCFKCVYEGVCTGSDKDGMCSQYKRDPPDGGYYG